VRRPNADMNHLGRSQRRIANSAQQVQAPEPRKTRRREESTRPEHAARRDKTITTSEAQAIFPQEWPENRDF
jgi:hypothetical protein